jgi:hypothetical protein
MTTTNKVEKKGIEFRHLKAPKSYVFKKQKENENYRTIGIENSVNKVLELIKSDSQEKEITH